jgi:4-amino-4-deoxy-L-arabinose transferase-like glycosyltransferase
MIFTGGHGARTASTDVPLMFFGTLFVFLTWTALTGNRSELLPLVGIAAGLAILTKSFNAGIFLIAVAPLALYHIKIFISHKTADMIALTAVISIPWYAYAWIKYQDLFIYEIFTSQALQRATGESFGRQSDTLFGFMRFRYFQEFPSFFNPWSYFLFSAIIGLTIIAVTLRENSEIKKFAFLVWWAASIFIFFIFAGNNGWYIMPMFVPCSILIGRFLSDIPERNPVVLLFTALSIALIVWKSGINIDVILISIGIFGLLLLDTIKTYLDNTISEEDYDLAKKTIPVFLCIMFIIIFASIVPLSVGGPAYSDQEQLGQIANQEVPSEQLIIKTPNVAYSWEFSFYAENTVMRGGINTLNADTDINYALIKSGAKSRITREHTTIADSGQLSLVRLQ